MLSVLNNQLNNHRYHENLKQEIPGETRSSWNHVLLLKCQLKLDFVHSNILFSASAAVSDSDSLAQVSVEKNECHSILRFICFQNKVTKNLFTLFLPSFFEPKFCFETLFWHNRVSPWFVRSFFKTRLQGQFLRFLSERIVLNIPGTRAGMPVAENGVFAISTQIWDSSPFLLDVLKRTEAIPSVLSQSQSLTVFVRNFCWSRENFCSRFWRKGRQTRTWCSPVRTVSSY